MKKALLTLFFSVLVFIGNVNAQCAMCRASVENNYSSGETSIAAGLNTGIIYLFVMPYLIVALVGFLWYRNSKRNAQQLSGDN